MFCKYCGKELEDGARFCPYCGMDQMTGEEEDAGANKGPVSEKQNTKASSSAGQKSDKRAAGGSHSNVKTGPVIAIVMAVLVVVVFIFGITRNSSNTTVTAWVVGEGRTSVGSETTASNNKIPYQDQINTIYSHFNDYEIADPYMDSVANASYRTFELLCVIAEELDPSGTYANIVAQSAASRYEEMDAQIDYANIQVVNGLYRCAEMLASILYELEGEDSVSEISNIMATIISNPGTENFLECKESVTTAIPQLLYYISFRLNLPNEYLDSIKNEYNTWYNYNDVIKSEKSIAIYDVNERLSLESLLTIYNMLDYISVGLESNHEYADSINAIADRVTDTADSCHFYVKYNALPDETEEALWEATLLDANMRFSEIIAEILSN